MKAFLKHINLFLLPVLLLITILFIVSPDKQYAYHQLPKSCDNKGDWIYQRIFENEKNIDVLFLGTSRTICAINDSLLESQVAKKVNIANLAFCRGGRSLHYSLLKDVLKKHQLKLLVLEVVENEDRFSHPDFPFIADASDLFNAPLIINQRYFEGIWKGFKVRYESLRNQVLKKDIAYTRQFHDKDHKFKLHHFTASAESMAQRKEQAQKKKWNPDFHQELIRRLSIQYLEKIVELCEANKIELFFMYQPAYGYKSLNDFPHQKYYQNIAPLFIPAQKIMDDPTNWSDQEHMNIKGTHELSPSIAEEINKYL